MKKNLFLKSIVFTILYVVATVAISVLKHEKQIVEVLSERWYEYIILFFVILWFNNFIDKKGKNNNKFYKDL
jgi:hypothetical protein